MKFFPVILLLFFCSCKILHSPRIKADGEIEGLTSKKHSYHEEETFIIMHGVGRKDHDYSEKLIRRLSDFKFGKNNYQIDVSVYKGNIFELRPNESLKEVYETYYNQGDVEALKIVTKSLSGPVSEENIYYSINWALAVDERKDSLVRTEVNNSPFYFGVNKALKKKLMMETVSDVLSGSSPEIVEGLYDLLCSIIIDGRIKSKKKLNVITGSFGSQLFIGLLNEIQKFDKSLFFNEEFDRFSQKFTLTDKGLAFDPNGYKSSMKSSIYDKLKDTLSINSDQRLRFYCLTNQLNLMPTNIMNWFSHLNSDTSMLQFKSVQIVAFRNPNDLLCYYLPSEVAKKYFPPDVEVINTYYFNWPFRNDALNAHTVVFNSKKLAKIIHYGSSSGWVKKNTKTFE